VGAFAGLKSENEVENPVTLLWMKSLPELQAANK